MLKNRTSILLEEKGMSILALQKKIGTISYNSIRGAIKKEELDSISLHTLFMISRALGVEVNELYTPYRFLITAREEKKQDKGWQELSNEKLVGTGTFDTISEAVKALEEDKKDRKLYLRDSDINNRIDYKMDVELLTEEGWESAGNLDNERLHFYGFEGLEFYNEWLKDNDISEKYYFKS